MFRPQLLHTARRINSTYVAHETIQLTVCELADPQRAASEWIPQAAIVFANTPIACYLAIEFILPTKAARK